MRDQTHYVVAAAVGAVVAVLTYVTTDPWLYIGGGTIRYMRAPTELLFVERLLAGVVAYFAALITTRFVTGRRRHRSRD